ncbi:MAG: glycyl-radical enzyme activating protein [Candidatus Lokiarchaeota archaeon]|nr:glycyl-radical enzyme activating protein [Candidatus Lokiarchaeota archaeon]MBD3339637.1 glycyl-radical enzyme activating protein [Candidatus Lokiarchaeota archaeon]
MSTENKLLVFHIQRFVLHDGPGIRTTVFLKGCPLRCKWCHNPEGLEAYPELGYIESRCVLCQKCVEICPVKAIEIWEEGVSINRKDCSVCFKCVNICPSKALEIIGEYKTPEEIIHEVMNDVEFYEESGGGLTISGGEPLAQSKELLELLKKAKENNLHICLDTTGYRDWEVFENILDYVDVVLYDIKQLDDILHKELTGVSNQLILQNLKRCVKKNIEVLVRIPIIQGQNFNKVESELPKYLKHLIGLGIKRFELIPYHKFGEQKYHMMGKDYSIYIEPVNIETLSRVAHEMCDNYEVFIKISDPIVT